jgi:hypothetical protein
MTIETVPSADRFPDGFDTENDEAPAMEVPQETDVPSTHPSRPDGVPEKFWDSDRGAVRTEALVKSYNELERRLGSRPDSAEAYRIETDHPDMRADPAVNEALFEAGLTNEQAQTVYGLAEDYLAPLAQTLADRIATQRDVDWLAQRHGGEDAWRQMAPQVKQWGESRLPPDVYQSLASSKEGVAAMVRMMRSEEPAIGDRAAATAAPVTEESVKAMMRDPRYWRDQDPVFVAKVREGFERLYPD